MPATTEKPLTTSLAGTDAGAVPSVGYRMEVFRSIRDVPVADWDSLRRENRDPFITGRAALEPLKVILAIYESSSRGGSPVLLEELMP